jgi:Transposase DDE domain
MTQSALQKYQTTNWKDYNDALKKRGSMLIWIDKDMAWNGTPSGKRGRSKTYSDLAIQFCLMIKNLYGLGLRQTIGMVESLLKLANLDWRVPDFSTLSKRQKDLTVDIPYRRAAGGLHLLVDSTGIKMIGEGEWKTKKHGADYRRQWLKVHLAIDAESLAVRAIEVTTNEVGDAPMLPELLSQIPPDEAIDTVTADAFGKNGQAIIGAVWWKPKCAVSNY